MQTHIGRTHRSSQTQCSCPSLYFPCLLAFVCVCVRASTMAEETTHPAVHVHDISVFVLRNLHDSLSLSHLLVSVDHPLFVSSELLNISLFFFTFLPPPACLSLAFSIPPSFPLHRLWLASVKPLKRKRVHICECVCACERACMSLCVCMYEVVLLGWI